MNAEQIVLSAEKLLAPFAVGATLRAPGRIEAVIKRENLQSVVKEFIETRWGYLSAITGLDHPWPKAPKPGVQPAEPAAEPAGPVEDRLEVLYQFVSGPVVATLRVSVPYHDATVPTICPIIPSATLYERELQEMFGIVVEATPDTSRLLLPDDWPAGVFPLRKSFKGLEA